MDALWEESRDRAIRKQQLSGEINVLHEQILAGEQNDSHYRSRLLAVQEDTEKKSADQEALEEQKADLQANLREIDRKLADEQKKWTISRAASKNALRQWKMVRMRSLRSLIPVQTPKVRHSVLMP